MSRKNRNPKLDRAGAAALNTLIGGMNLLPYRGRLALAGALGRAAVTRLPRLMRRVNGNLLHVLPDLSDAERREVAREVGDTFGRTFFEILNNAAFHGHGAWSAPSGPGVDAVRTAAREGTGAVLVTGHFGQWEAVRAWLKSEDINCGAIYRPTDNPAINARYLANLEYGGTPIFPKSRRGFRSLVSHLGRGNFVAILTDQYEKRARRIDFVGQPAPTSFVAADLALKFGVPLIPAYGIRDADREHVTLAVEPPIAHSTSAQMMEAVNDSLASRIRAHPGQYYWLHRRWEKQLPGFSA